MTNPMRTVYLLVFLSVIWPASAATAQWPGFRGGLLRDATSSEVGLLQNWPDADAWQQDSRVAELSENLIESNWRECPV